MPPDPAAVAKAFDLLGLGLAPYPETRSDRFQAVAENFADWDLLARLLQDRHVTPLAYASLRAAGLLTRFPPSLSEAMHRLYQQTAAGNSLRLHHALQLTTRLAERGIPALYLKGASLVLAGDYPNPGLRMFSDVDLLVDPLHQEQVRAVFREAGEWQELAPAHPRNWKQTQWLNPWGTMIEIHWRLYSFNAVPSERVEHRLWSAARQVNHRGHPAWVPAAEDRFIQAALHGTAHHGFDTAFLFLSFADLAHLAGNPRAPLDWNRMAQILRHERMLEHAALAVELAWEFTRFSPLQEGLAVFHAADPQLANLTAPLGQQLLRLLRRTRPFSAETALRLLARKPLPVRLRLAALAALTAWFPSLRRQKRVPAGWVEIPTLDLKVTPPRGGPDWDEMVFWWRLAQFYRRLGYQGLE